MMQKAQEMHTLIPKWTEYELLDSGAGKKLERFGKITLIRPEPQAKWTAKLPEQQWEAAGGEFVKARSGQRVAPLLMSPEIALLVSLKEGHPG